MSDDSASGPKATDDRTIAQIIERKTTVSSRRGLIGLGASSSGERASDADAMLAEGFGRD